MGRAPCCDKANVKKGPWSPEEDNKLRDFIQKYGTGGNWIALPHKAGLKRCGKSCRLRWLNYLRPNLKHGGFSDDEDRIICTLFATIGSRWSIIAGQLPGRTDNDIKNYWNTKLKKKLMGAINAAPESQNPTPIDQRQLFFPPPLTTSQYVYYNSTPNTSAPTLCQDPSLSQYHISAEQSCSSSEISHGKEFNGHSYLYGGLEDQNLKLGFRDAHGDQYWEGGPPLLDYGNYEEINNLVMIGPTDYSECNNNNNNNNDDDDDLASSATFMYNF